MRLRCTNDTFKLEALASLYPSKTENLEYTNTSMCYIVGHRPCGWQSCSATNLSRRTCLARPKEFGLLWRDFSIPARCCARPLRTGDMWLLVTSLLTSSARMDCSRYLGMEWEAGMEWETRNGMGDWEWNGIMEVEWETGNGMGDWEWNGRLGMRQVHDKYRRGFSAGSCMIGKVRLLPPWEISFQFQVW